MKKLLLGSALAASVLLAGSSYAETKVSGYLETTVTSSESKTAGVAGTSTPSNIGHEASIDLKTSKELDNGFTMTAGFGTQDGSIADQYLKLATGNTTLAIGSDVTGVTDNVSLEDFTGHINQSFHDIGIGGITGAGSISVHGGNAFYVIQKSDMITFEGAYAPTSSGTGSSAASATTQTTGSGYDLAVHGNLGVEGLKVGYGITEASQDGTSSLNDEVATYGIKYSMGGFTVGYGNTTTKIGGNDGIQVEKQSSSMGVVYAVSDALSVGVYTGLVEVPTVVDDESLLSVQVGYDFGGMGLTVGYYEAEDVAGVRGTDSSVFEVRTVTKF